MARKVCSLSEVCWGVQLPAGLIDSDETAADAALRELKEETGMPCALHLAEPPCRTMTAS